MALELGGFTPVGYAEGVNLSLPPNGSLTITSGSPAQVASFRAAAAAGGVRIKIDAGVSLALSSRLDFGAWLQILTLSGTAQIDTTAIASTAALGCNAADIWLGNLEFLCHPGVVSDGGNDLAGLFAFDAAAADRFYVWQCRRVIPSSAGGDAPEGFNAWNNGPAASDGPNRVTFAGWLASPNSHGSKNAITGGSASAANTRVTIYRSALYQWQRGLFLQNGAKGDIVSTVLPAGVDRIDAFNNVSGELNVRGSAIGKTADSTGSPDERYEITGGASTYAPLQPSGGVDGNLLIDWPANPINGGVPLVSASKASPYALPYVLTPAAMDTALMNAILASAGPGIYTITEGGAAAFPAPATRRNLLRSLA